MSYKDIKSFEEECRDKDAEIARLRAALEAIDDHGRASAFMEALREQKKLIAELCEALGSMPMILHPPHRELLTRAREALQ